MSAVFYRPEQSALNPTSYSPSAGKPALVMADWIERFGDAIDVRTFKPVGHSGLSLAHDPDYVRDVLNGVRANGFGTVDLEVAKSLPYTTGSVVAAALHALDDRIAISPTSGFHHAGYAHGAGFCTFNGLMVAAIMAHRAGAQRIFIIDEDQHFSDGCVDIIDRLGLDYVRLHSLGAQAGDGEQCLDALDDAIYRMMPGADLVIYQAGADCHVNDPLGGTYTTEQMADRDRMVFGACRRRKVPLCWNLAGGYQRDDNGGIEPVLALHRQTMSICLEMFK